jgi:invasion protein IalB
MFSIFAPRNAACCHRRPLRSVRALAVAMVCLGLAQPAAAQSNAVGSGWTTATQKQQQIAQQKAKGQNTPAPAPAQAPAASPPAAPAAAAWAVTCSDRVQGKFTCEMTQSVIDGASRQIIAYMSIRAPEKGGSTAMLIRLLHGIYLPAGLAFRIDEAAPVALAFQKSDQLGVYAALPLADKVLQDMRRGTQITLAIQVNKDQPLEIKGSLNGFANAYEKIVSLN